MAEWDGDGGTDWRSDENHQSDHNKDINDTPPRYTDNNGGIFCRLHEVNIFEDKFACQKNKGVLTCLACPCSYMQTISLNRYLTHINNVFKLYAAVESPDNQEYPKEKHNSRFDNIIE